MSVLLVVNTAPYGSEGPYNAFRLADALALRGEHVEVFLWATRSARRGPARTREGRSVSRADARRPPGEGRRRELLRHLLRDARTLRGPAHRSHARATIHDLAEATVRNDRIVSF